MSWFGPEADEFPRRSSWRQEQACAHSKRLAQAQSRHLPAPSQGHISRKPASGGGAGMPMSQLGRAGVQTWVHSGTYFYMQFVFSGMVQLFC